MKREFLTTDTVAKTRDLDLARLAGASHAPERHYAITEFAVILNLYVKVRPRLVELVEIPSRRSTFPSGRKPALAESVVTSGSGSSSRSTASLPRAL